MTDGQQAIAQRCKQGAEDDTMTFPAIVAALAGAGFDGYSVDFRRGAATYYLADGGWTDLALDHPAGAVGAAFDTAAVRQAIAEAQALAPGYTYRGFCRKVTAAGCVGYLVSIAGRRVVYLGRTGDTHTELFPDQG